MSVCSENSLGLSISYEFMDFEDAMDDDEKYENVLGVDRLLIANDEVYDSNEPMMGFMQDVFSIF